MAPFWRGRCSVVCNRGRLDRVSQLPVFGNQACNPQDGASNEEPKEKLLRISISEERCNGFTFQEHMTTFP